MCPTHEIGESHCSRYFLREERGMIILYMEEREKVCLILKYVRYTLQFWNPKLLSIN